MGPRVLVSVVAASTQSTGSLAAQVCISKVSLQVKHCLWGLAQQQQPPSAQQQEVPQSCKLSAVCFVYMWVSCICSNHLPYHGMEDEEAAARGCCWLRAASSSQVAVLQIQMQGMQPRYEPYTLSKMFLLVHLA